MAFSNASTTLKNALGTAWATQLDNGTTNAKGALQIRTSGGTTLLVSIPLALSDFTVSSGQAVASSIAAVVNTATGTAAVGRYVDRDGTTINEISITATSGGGDLELDDTSIVANGSNTTDLGTITVEFGT